MVQRMRADIAIAAVLHVTRIKSTCKLCANDVPRPIFVKLLRPAGETCWFPLYYDTIYTWPHAIEEKALYMYAPIGEYKN